jgi:hypothetical protein
LTAAQQIPRRTDTPKSRGFALAESLHVAPNFRCQWFRETRLPPGEHPARRGTAMPTAIKDLPICVALILALVAAVMSTPGQTGRPYQALRWMPVGVSPEADMLAGAIGEIPANVLSP